MTRNKARKMERNGPCRTYWGSHGCHKPAGHLGRHFCGSDCPQPTDDDEFEQRPDGSTWVRILTPTEEQQ